MFRYSVAMAIMILMITEVCFGAVFYDIVELDIDHKYSTLPSIKLNDSGEPVSTSYVFGEEYLMLRENGSGQDVGLVNVEGGVRAIFRNDGKLYTFTVPDGARSMPFGINKGGDVVGSFMPPGEIFPNAFLCDGHAFVTYLGNFGGNGSVAFAINNLRQIVGVAGVSADVAHAFLYEDGVITDLNELIPHYSGWELWEAQDIDDKGRIVGFGLLRGELRSFLLNPLNEVPEGAKRIPFVSRSYVFEQYLMLGENEFRPWDTESYDFGFLSGQNEDSGPWDTESYDFGFLYLVDFDDENKSARVH